jgi:hypothetical protein
MTNPTTITKAEWLLLGQLMDWAMEAFHRAMSSDIAVDDSAAHRALIQRIIGDEFELRTIRGRLVVGGADVAEYFANMARGAQGDAAADLGALAPVDQVVASVMEQLEAAFDAPEAVDELFTHVSGDFDRAVIDQAEERLLVELEGLWTFYSYRCDNGQWGIRLALSS